MSTTDIAAGPGYDPPTNLDEPIKATYRGEDGLLYSESGSQVVDTDDRDSVVAELVYRVNSVAKRDGVRADSAFDRLRDAQGVAYMAAQLVHLEINNVVDKYVVEHGGADGGGYAAALEF